MIIEEIPLSKLKKTKFLKRKHSKDQLEKCIHSLKTYGQYAPIIVSGKEILCGTLVYDALKQLKEKKAFIIQVGELTDEKKKELRYLDNRTFEMSFWKDDELKIFLMSLNNDELKDCGFDEMETENFINGFDDSAKSIKSKVLNELNKQPETWYCPECGWQGSIEEN